MVTGQTTEGLERNLAVGHLARNPETGALEYNLVLVELLPEESVREESALEESVLEPVAELRPATALHRRLYQALVSRHQLATP